MNLDTLITELQAKDERILELENRLQAKDERILELENGLKYIENQILIPHTHWTEILNKVRKLIHK